jgi:5-methylcytosine-specific restriction endonuclease McrA
MSAWNKGLKLRGNCPLCDNEYQITNKSGHRRRTCLRCTRKQASLTLKRKGIKPPTQTGKRWGVDYPIENHNWWKGGISPTRVKIWHSQEFQNWRTSIFKRDKYTCKICGKRGGKLNVDHFPIPFSEILEMRNIKSLEEAIMCEDLWNLQNGRTLCVECHRLTPTYGVNQRFRKEQYVS